MDWHVKLVLLAALVLSCWAAVAQTQVPPSAYVAPSPSFTKPQPLVTFPASGFPTPVTSRPDEPRVNAQLPSTQRTNTPASTPSQEPSPTPRWMQPTKSSSQTK